MKHFILCLILSFFATYHAASQELNIPGMPKPGVPKHFPVPELRSEVLSNGLNVLFVKVNDIPSVDFNLLVHAGVDKEMEGNSGVAYLTHKMMMLGTTGRSARELASEFARLGSVITSAFQYEYSQVYVTSSVQNVPQTLRLLAEVITTPGFDSSRFVAKKEIIIQDIFSAVDNPATLTTQALLSKMYGESSPYSFTRQGRFRDVYSMDVGRCQEFYQQYYRPNNAVLIVAGNIDFNSLLPLLEERLVGWESAPIPDSKQKSPNLTESKVVIIDNTDVKQAIIRIGYQATKRDSKDFERLILMNQLFGGGNTSRLGRAFWGERTLASNFGSGLVFHNQSGYCVISGSLPNRYVDTALTVVDETVQFMMDSLITNAELFDAKKLFTDNFDMEFATNKKAQRQFQELAIYGLPLDYYNGYLDAFSSISSETIRETANALFGNPSIIVVTGDAEVLEPKLAAKFQLPIEVLSKDDVIARHRPKAPVSEQKENSSTKP